MNILRYNVHYRKKRQTTVVGRASCGLKHGSGGFTKPVITTVSEIRPKGVLS